MTRLNPESEAFTITKVTATNYSDLVVQASHPLWEEDGPHPSEHGLFFERVLGGHSKEAPFPYEISSSSSPSKLPQTGNPHQVLLVKKHNVDLHNGTPDVHAFNERVMASRTPQVDILQHPENKRLLIAHRSHAYGRLVVAAVNELEFVQRAGVIGEDIPAEGPLALYKAFPRGVVLGAVVDPATDVISHVRQEIKTLVTQDWRPGSSSGL